MSNQPTYPNPWHKDDPVEWSPITKTWRFTTKYKVDHETEKLLWSGRLNQLCNYCSHVEPAGPYCSNCKRQLDPNKTWFKPQSLGEDGKPRRGRPKRSDALKMVGALNANT